MPEGSDPGPGRGGLVLESRPMPILESVEAEGQDGDLSGGSRRVVWVTFHGILSRVKMKCVIGNMVGTLGTSGGGGATDLMT
jgi:hypothetical protein